MTVPNLNFGKAKETLGYTTIDLSICHANSYSHGMLRNPYAQPYHSALNCTPILCNYCESSNQDINSCPHHMNDAHYTNLEKLMNDMIEK